MIEKGGNMVCEGSGCMCVVLVDQQLLHSCLRPLVLALQLPMRFVGPLAVGLEILEKASPFFEIEVFAEIFLRCIHTGSLRVDE